MDRNVILFKKNNNSYFFTGLFFIILSVFLDPGGDFLNYLKLYNNYNQTHIERHLEPYYTWLIDVLPKNFYIWRLFVWGPAIILWMVILKHLKLNPHLSFILLLTIPLYNFVGARQQMGFSFLYLGMAICLYKNYNTLKISTRSFNIIVGLILIGLSLFFHKSMILYLSVFLIALIPFKRKTIVISLILFPIIWSLLNVLVEFFISNIMAFDAAGQDHAERFVDAENKIETTLYGWIRIFIDKIPIWVLLYLSIKKVFFSKQPIKIPYFFKVILKMTYILIYFYALFIGKDVSKFLGPRFWDAALIPLSIFLAYFLFNEKRNKILNFTLLLLVVGKLYTFFYSFYKL